LPALPDVPGVIRIDHHFQLSEDQFAKCRLFLAYTGTAPTNADLNEFCDDCMADYGTDLKGLAGVDTILESVSCIDLTSSTSASGLSSASPITGTRAGGVLPAAIAALVSKEVHRRYRGGHPRTYWPFGTQTDMFDEQTWLVAFTAAVGTDYQSYISDIRGEVWAGATLTGEVNVSYYSGFTVHTGTTGRARNVSTPRGSAIVDVVVEIIARVGIAVIRKRLLGLA
jgi:hypothetical protein